MKQNRRMLRTVLVVILATLAAGSARAELGPYPVGVTAPVPSAWALAGAAVPFEPGPSVSTSDWALRMTAARAMAAGRPPYMESGDSVRPWRSADIGMVSPLRPMIGSRATALTAWADRRVSAGPAVAIGLTIPTYTPNEAFVSANIPARYMWLRQHRSPTSALIAENVRQSPAGSAVAQPWR